MLAYPGPNFLVVVESTLNFGRVASIVTGLGVALGDAVYASVGLFGISRAIGLSGDRMIIIEFLGGMYLAWLGTRIGVFPCNLERLRGTPVRTKDLVAGLREDELEVHLDGKWSVKEHLGHLIYLQPLDECRLEEFLKGVEILSAADMENRATKSADHGNVPVADMIQRLTLGRQLVVRRLEALTEDDLSRVALHPRLYKSMRLSDWVHLLAEHDDHHLASARAVIMLLHREAIERMKS